MTLKRTVYDSQRSGQPENVIFEPIIKGPKNDNFDWDQVLIPLMENSILNFHFVFLEYFSHILSPFWIVICFVVAYQYVVGLPY